MKLFKLFQRKSVRNSEILLHIRESFSRVRNDNEILYQWVQYLHRQLQRYDQEFHKLYGHISAITPSKESLHKLIGEYHSNLGLLDRLKSIEQRMEFLYQHGANSSTAIAEIHQKLEHLAQKKQEIKSRLIEKIARNSKDYVKSLIVDIIEKQGEVSANKLREMFVEEKGLCSKSSFYRILEEIEQTTSVGVIRAGREKHYVLKVDIKR